MRILLVQPPGGDTIGLNSVFLAEPLGLEMVASSLEPDHECAILDMRVDPNLDGSLSSFRPDACGISCSFTPDVNRTIRIAARIKERLPECFVFAGGHHASQRPKDFSSSRVDAVVMGDGEGVSREFLKALGAGRDLESIPSVFLPLRARGDPIHRKAALPDMEGLPLPARHLVERYRSMYQMGLEWPVYSVETARGCPYRCRFCSVWELYGGTRRERPVGDILKDLDSIPGENIFFTDDLFFLDTERSETLATEIRRAGIRKRFTCQARADRIAGNRELLRLWREIGLRRVFIGLEGTTDSVLREFRKGYGSKVNEEALAVLDELEISANGQFIVTPEFSRTAFRDLLSYVRVHRIPFPSFTILTPLPGTAWYEEKRDQLLTEEPEMFDLFHCVLPTALPVEGFYEEFARLYRESYFSRPFRLPSYRILRHLLTADGFRRFMATTRNLKALCDPRTYLKAHAPNVLDNKKEYGI